MKSHHREHDGVSVRERLLVHRAVEAARVQLAGVDSLDAESVVRAWCKASGVTAVLSEAARAVLEDELARLIARHEKEHADVDWALYAEGDDEALYVQDAARPVDPYGELAGGRVGATCLLGRRCDEPSPEEGDLFGEVMGP